MKKTNKPNKKKSSSKWKWILFVLLLLIVAGIYVLLTEFKVEKITIEGNTRYTKKEIKEMVIKNSYLENSLVMYVMNRLRPIEGVPFIDKITVTYVNRRQVAIDVYEMAIAGCVEDMGKYIYFDRDGYVLESDDERFEDVPCVEGLSFNRFILHEKLPIEDKEKFEQILRVTQLIQENELQIDRVRFGIAGDLILYKDDIVIQIGKENHLEEKMMNLPGILAKAEGMKGTLHMEEFGSDSKIVTFIPEKVKKSSKKQNKNSAQT